MWRLFVRTAEDAARGINSSLPVARSLSLRIATVFTRRDLEIGGHRLSDGRSALLRSSIRLVVSSLARQ